MKKCFLETKIIYSILDTKIVYLHIPHHSINSKHIKTRLRLASVRHACTLSYLGGLQFEVGAGTVSETLSQPMNWALWVCACYPYGRPLLGGLKSEASPWQKCETLSEK
jgi:hypothetical protein